MFRFLDGLVELATATSWLVFPRSSIVTFLFNLCDRFLKNNFIPGWVTVPDNAKSLLAVNANALVFPCLAIFCPRLAHFLVWTHALVSFLEVDSLICLPLTRKSLKNLQRFQVEKSITQDIDNCQRVKYLCGFSFKVSILGH